jgi:hypothetical protein
MRGVDIALEHERALQRVVALDVEVDADLGVLRLVTRRLAHEHGRSGNRREHGVRQCRGVAGRARVRLELRIPGLAELERASAALHRKRDGHLLDRHDLADELRQVGDGPALLAGVDGEQRVLLLLGYLVVEVDGGGPVALQDVARDVSDHRDRSARHVDAVDRSLVEMPGDDGVAGAVVRILSDPARAQHAAVANLQQASFEVIRHATSHGKVGGQATSAGAEAAGERAILRRRAPRRQGVGVKWDRSSGVRDDFADSTVATRDRGGRSSPAALDAESRL